MAKGTIPRRRGRAVNPVRRAWGQGSAETEKPSPATISSRVVAFASAAADDSVSSACSRTAVCDGNIGPMVDLACDQNADDGIAGR